MGHNPFEVLEMDIEECLERYSTPNTPTNSGQNRPVTPIGQALAPQTTPGKKRAKRKANSPMPAITPIRMGKPGPRPSPSPTGKSATAYLGLAQKALYAAIEAEKREKREQYVEDNDIQLLTNELEAILAERPREPQQESLDGLTGLELRGQLDQLNARLDTLAAEIKGQGQMAQRRQKEQIPRPQPLPQQAAQQKTFAEALRGPNPPKPSPKESQKAVTYKERRLILKGTSGKETIDSRGLRDKMNQAFREKNQILTPVVGTVARSLRTSDIVISTTEKFDAEFLRKNEATWKPLFNFNKAIRDTTWGKIVIHGILTEIFNTEGGMELLEEEIRVFNGLNPIIKPR